MQIVNCSKKDFDQILLEIADFWGDDRLLYLHHPILLYEFGNTAYVIKEGDRIVAYLFGFLSQTDPAAYVHLVGVRQSHRRKGLGRQLYENFIAFAKTRGCTKIRAITLPTMIQSIAFHKSIGMELLGNPNEDGIPVVKDYSGPVCAFQTLDLGIALCSAVKLAADLNIDNRMMYTVGVAAKDLKLLDADIIVGIPLSVSGKSPYFDRT